MDFDSYIRGALEDLRTSGLLRSPRPVRGAHGPVLNVHGRQVVGLCSNNYLGLADHPRIAEATAEALRVVGTGAAASRHISGTNMLHRQVETRLASFVGLPAALLFSTGYAANLGAIQSVVGSDDAIFSDELNHASLIDGARLSRARVFVYRHLDSEHLASLLEQYRRRFQKALIATESVFSMEGDLAPLVTLRGLADRHRCGLLVDEAHALGVLGPRGHGLSARELVRADLLVGTLGKAFGCSGAFAAGSAAIVSLLENRARSYVFSTAPPPALAAAALTALDLVEAADSLRTRLLQHSRRLRSSLQGLGYRVADTDSPILPILVGEPEPTMALSAALLEQGVFVHGIRPPTVPAGTSRLRVTPIATHSDDHIDRAIAAFEACRYLI